MQKFYYGNYYDDNGQNRGITFFRWSVRITGVGPIARVIKAFLYPSSVFVRYSYNSYMYIYETYEVFGHVGPWANLFVYYARSWLREMLYQITIFIYLIALLPIYIPLKKCEYCNLIRPSFIYVITGGGYFKTSRRPLERDIHEPCLWSCMYMLMEFIFCLQFLLGLFFIILILTHRRPIYKLFFYWIHYLESCTKIILYVRKVSQFFMNYMLITDD